MEPTEKIEPTSPGPGLVLTEQAKYYLLTAGRWANFLGILGFIFTGLMVIEAIFVGTIFSHLPQSQSFPGATLPIYASIMGSMGGLIAFFCLAGAVFYFFFSYYLYTFADRIKKGILFNDSIGLTGALERLKSFFKLWGITTIVVIALYILGIIVAIVVFASVHAMH
jgi:hypothetical protein